MDLRSNYKQYVTGTKENKHYLKCGLKTRLGFHWTPRHTSEKIKKTKQRDLPRTSSTGSSSRETDVSDVSPPKRLRPAKKDRLGSLLNYGVKINKRGRNERQRFKEKAELKLHCSPYVKPAPESQSIFSELPPHCSVLISRPDSGSGDILKHDSREDSPEPGPPAGGAAAGGGGGGGGGGGPSEEVKPQIVSHLTAVHVTNQLQLSSYVTRRINCQLPRSHSLSSLSKTAGAKTQLTRADSFPDLLFKEFTPVITADFDEETYRFQCSGPGLYQCTVTGLVFHMEGGGDVVYRTVPWNRRLLSPHRVKPAGPLFDIRSVQQCVCQLHLPHCELLSTGGSHFLSVAHVSDEGVELIRPQRITHTHVVINITGFSAYGNVKDEDSPPDPVRALVLLFYRPPRAVSESTLNVLLLPRNIVVRDVQRTRRKLVGDEIYIDKPPHCKLQPKQVYTLAVSPQSRSVQIEPQEAEFDGEFHSSYFPTFQVTLKRKKTNIKLVLKHKSSLHVVWETQVCLPSTEERNLGLAPKQKLMTIRSSLIKSISEPVVKSLLDKLLEKGVITDCEMEDVQNKNRRDKAQCVIDTVRRKGEAASSKMMEFLRELDPFLCRHLGLMRSKDTEVVSV